MLETLKKTSAILAVGDCAQSACKNNEGWSHDGPFMVQIWSQYGPRMALQRPQYGPRMVPERSQNDPKVT